MVENGHGGWRLHVICTVCGAEALYKGVVMALAADHAQRDGWVVDRAALYVAAPDRYALCPRHAPESP